MSNFFSKGPDYFGLFEKGIQIANKAATILQAAFADSRINVEKIKQLKEIEHEGDQHVHKCAELIADAFITPIERPDMMNLIATIEALTDSIDDIANQVYMMHIAEKDEVTEKFIQLIVQACKELCQMMSIFKHFKKAPNKIHEISIRVNHIEEEGDTLFTDAMRALFDPANKMETIEIVRRQNLYNVFENCLDCCEDVADIVGQIIISNT
jgi:hypothetical protein